MMKDFLQNFKIKILQTVIIIFLLQQISSQKSISSCNEHSDDFYNHDCFNGVILLPTCKAGQFASDKYGNMFILYTSSLGESGDINRVLYALNKNGTNYFPTTPWIEYKINEGSGIREFSRIIFLNLEKNNKQYLLRTSLWYTSFILTELYEIGKNDVSENEIT